MPAQRPNANVLIRVDFALGGLPRMYLFDLQDFRLTESVKTNYLRHLIFLSFGVSDFA